MEKNFRPKIPLKLVDLCETFSFLQRSEFSYLIAFFASFSLLFSPHVSVFLSFAMFRPRFSKFFCTIKLNYPKIIINLCIYCESFISKLIIISSLFMLFYAFYGFYNFSCSKCSLVSIFCMFQLCFWLFCIVFLKLEFYAVSLLPRFFY